MTPEEEARVLEVLAGQMNAMSELLGSARHQLGLLLTRGGAAGVPEKAETIKVYNGMEVR